MIGGDTRVNRELILQNLISKRGILTWGHIPATTIIKVKRVLHITYKLLYTHLGDNMNPYNIPTIRYTCDRLKTLNSFRALSDSL